MKIAIVADKKAGHLSQCLGLRNIIKKYSIDKDVFILGKDLIDFQTILASSKLQAIPDGQTFTPILSIESLNN